MVSARTRQTQSRLPAGLEWGAIPLPSAVTDPLSQFSVAEVSLSGIMQATHPEENVLILPNDVITVPRAALVYVVGEVKKQGGFILQERATISGLQALAMAEGFTLSAAPQNAVIIRQSSDKGRIEIATNLKEILGGKEKRCRTPARGHSFRANECREECFRPYCADGYSCRDFSRDLQGYVLMRARLSARRWS